MTSLPLTVSRSVFAEQPSTQPEAREHETLSSSRYLWIDAGLPLPKKYKHLVHYGSHSGPARDRDRHLGLLQAATRSACNVRTAPFSRSFLNARHKVDFTVPTDIPSRSAISESVYEP